MMRWTLGLLLWGRNRGMAGRNACGPWGHVAPGLDPTQPDVWTLHVPQKWSEDPQGNGNAHAYP